MPSPKPQWPKEIVVCLECGEPGTMDGYFAPYCSQGAEHGPTQTTSVIPTSEAEKLVEALGEAIDFAEEGWAYASDYFRDKWEFERERDKLRAALNHYRTLQGGEQGRG